MMWRKARSTEEALEGVTPLPSGVWITFPCSRSWCCALLPLSTVGALRGRDWGHLNAPRGICRPGTQWAPSSAGCGTNLAAHLGAASGGPGQGQVPGRARLAGNLQPSGHSRQVRGGHQRAWEQSRRIRGLALERPGQRGRLGGNQGAPGTRHQPAPEGFCCLSPSAASPGKPAGGEQMLSALGQCAVTPANVSAKCHPAPEEHPSVQRAFCASGRSQGQAMSWGSQRHPGHSPFQGRKRPCLDRAPGQGQNSLMTGQPPGVAQQSSKTGTSTGKPIVLSADGSRSQSWGPGSRMPCVHCPALPQGRSLAFFSISPNPASPQSWSGSPRSRSWEKDLRSTGDPAGKQGSDPEKGRQPGKDC